MYHKTNEPFEYNGKRYVAVEDNSVNTCWRCAFYEDPVACFERKCEAEKRQDNKMVRFDEVV